MIQIELQPRTKTHYAAEAEVRGLALEQYLAERLEAEVIPVPGNQRNAAEKLADLDLFFKEMVRYADKIPVLSDEAFTRESIYQDHP